MPEVVTPGWKMELLQGAAEVGCQLFDGAAAQARTILIYYFDSCYFTTCQDAAGPATRPPLPAHHCAERGSRRSFSLFLFTRFLVLLLQLLHVLFVASPNQHHPPLLHNQWVALEKI